MSLVDESIVSTAYRYEGLVDVLLELVAIWEFETPVKRDVDVDRRMDELLQALKGLSNPWSTRFAERYDRVMAAVERSREGARMWRAGKKEKKYCHFFLNHGRCSFASQGCLFSHEKPEDLEERRRLGLVERSMERSMERSTERSTERRGGGKDGEILCET